MRGERLATAIAWVILILTAGGCHSTEAEKFDCADGKLAGCEAACKAGVLGTNGCYSAGRMHREGMGVLKNERRAAFFFSKACGDRSRGRPAFGSYGAGCLAAALLYRDGSGVDADPGRAFELFKRGCELKNAVACEAVAENLEADGQVHEDRAVSSDRVLRAEFDAAKADYTTACKIRIPPLSECERARNIDLLLSKKYKPPDPDL